MKNWVVNDIRVGNVAVKQPSEPYVEKRTPYHSPKLSRTLLDGPGNRSKIHGCSCGAKFDGVYEYVGHDRRMCDWYAAHARIKGGGPGVTQILSAYDRARDARDYPDHPRRPRRDTTLSPTSGVLIKESSPASPASPEDLLSKLRTEVA